MEITLRGLWTLIHGMGFGGALSAGMFGRARGAVSRHHVRRPVRIHTRPRSLREALPHHDDRPRMGRRADRSLRHLPLVSRHTAAGNTSIYPCFRNACSCRAPPRSAGTPSGWSGRSTSPGLLQSRSPWWPSSSSSTVATSGTIRNSARQSFVSPSLRLSLPESPDSSARCSPNTLPSKAAARSNLPMEMKNEYVRSRDLTQLIPPCQMAQAQAPFSPPASAPLLLQSWPSPQTNRSTSRTP